MPCQIDRRVIPTLIRERIGTQFAEYDSVMDQWPASIACFLFARISAMLDRIKKSLTLAGVSAGVMYLFDPDLGGRRRSLLRDKVTHARNKIRKSTDVVFRDMEHRLYGAFCELRAKLRGRDTSDEVVVDRVRSKLGRYRSHPSSIEVHVRDGCVTLSGPVLGAEVADLLRVVKSVEGVREVENLLDVHPSPENISALQGGRRRTGEPAEWMQANWSPTSRVVAGTAGTVLMLNCLAKRTLPAITFGTAGFFLFLRAVTNPRIARITEIGTRGPCSDRIGETHFAGSPKVPAGSNTPQVQVEHATTLSSPIQHMHELSADELIDEASMQSFPASDAPSFTR